MKKIVSFLIKSCSTLILFLMLPVASSLSEWTEIPHESMSGITAIAVAPNGDLWGVGYVGTIFRVSNGSFTYFPGITTNDLNTVTVDPSGLVWVGGERGFFSIYWNGTWTNLDVGQNTETIHAIKVISWENIWFSYGQKLLHYDGMNLTTVIERSGYGDWHAFVDIEINYEHPEIVYVKEDVYETRHQWGYIDRIENGSVVTLFDIIGGTIYNRCQLTAASDWDIWIGNIQFDGIRWTLHDEAPVYVQQTSPDHESWFLGASGVGHWDGHGVAYYPFPCQIDYAQAMLRVTESGRAWLVTHQGAIYFADLSTGMNPLDFQFRLNPFDEDMSSPRLTPGKDCRLEAYLWNNTEQIYTVDVYIMLEVDQWIPQQQTQIHDYFFPSWRESPDHFSTVVAPHDFVCIPVWNFRFPDTEDIVYYNLLTRGAATYRDTYDIASTLGISTMAIRNEYNATRQ